MTWRATTTSIGKTVPTVRKPLKSHGTVEICVCAAVTHCILGISINKASSGTWKAVHAMLRSHDVASNNKPVYTH